MSGTKGAMNCIISSETTEYEELKAELAKVPAMDGLGTGSACKHNKHL